MSQSKDSEPAWTLGLLIMMVMAAAWVIWHFFHPQILEGLRWLRFSELWIINLFTHDKYGDCLHWLRAARVDDMNPSQEVIAYTNQCFGQNYLSHLPAEEIPNYYKLSVAGISTLAREITYYIHWPIAVAFGLVGMHMMYISPRNKFRTRHDLESFIRVQAKMWPVISPILKFNPIKSSARIPGSTVPDKLPLFAEALSPEEWISWHRIAVTNNIPDREATRRAFLQQLGPRWNGIDGTPSYVQALHAAFALKGVQKREESDDFLGELALCWSPKGGFKWTSDVAAKVHKFNHDPEIGGKANEITSQYAYRTTALLGVLRWARMMGGVLAPAQFLWLRAVDRSLWYALNNLGRRSFHSEGAGAMGHFMAEQSAKKPLPIPRIDTAIITLNQYLAERGMAIPPREQVR
jgi:intracellular multiplication protein IcmP